MSTKGKGRTVASTVVITANRLTDGQVVWLGAEGGWVESLLQASVAAGEAAAVALAAGQAAERAQLVVGVYAADVALTPQGARALYTAAAARGLPRVLDADVGDPRTVQSLLPLADHIIFSESGLAQMAGESDVEAGLRKAAALAPGVVGMTLGERGSVFRIDGVTHRVRAPAVEALDTNGAGDVFHGAYALAVAEGMRVLDAIRFASVAAALKCRSGSGWEAAPGRAAVNEFLKGCTW
jgi:sugar/nucleoside kinase (ribokinase family)